MNTNSQTTWSVTLFKVFVLSCVALFICCVFPLRCLMPVVSWSVQCLVLWDSCYLIPDELPWRMLIHWKISHPCLSGCEVCTDGCVFVGRKLTDEEKLLNCWLCSGNCCAHLPPFSMQLSVVHVLWWILQVCSLAMFTFHTVAHRAQPLVQFTFTFTTINQPINQC